MIQLPPNTQAIIFDLDGTLADTMPVHYAACQKVCKAKGFDFPESYFYQEAGKPTLEVFEGLVKMLAVSVDGRVLGQEKEEEFLKLIPTLKPIDIVAEVALTYKGKLPMAIGSGGQRESVNLTLEAIGYSNFFESVVTCDDVTAFKPHPETFLKCASEMQVDPKYCVVFEDGDPGIEAAKSAGMNYIDVRPLLK